MGGRPLGETWPVITTTVTASTVTASAGMFSNSYRGATDAASGFDVGTNEARLVAGGSNQAIAAVNQFRTASSGVELTSLGNFETRARAVNVPRAVTLAVAGDTISPTGASVVALTVPAGAVTGTATPFIADGVDGQELILRVVAGAGSFRVTDEGGLAGSNLELRAGLRDLVLDSTLALRFSTTRAAWVEEDWS